MAKFGTEEYWNNVKKGLKNHYKTHEVWNKGKKGYKRKTKDPKTASKNISQGVKKAWKEGKYNNVDYSKSQAQKDKLSEIKKEFYRNHPEVAKKHGEWVRKHQSGKNNNAWKGGITPQPYGPEFNKERKEKIRKKYNYRCQECFRHQNELGYKIPIHHIDYNKKNNQESNLISLCMKCHARTNFDREFWIKHFKNKQLLKIQNYPRNKRKIYI